MIFVYFWGMGLILILIILSLLTIYYLVKKTNNSNDSDSINETISRLRKEKQACLTGIMNADAKRDNTNGEYLIIDTETTGLPPRRDASVKELDNWPRIVSISLLLYDKEMVLIDEYYSLIKQVFPIPGEATQIHGITTEKANSEGKSMIEVFGEINKLANRCKYLVAHNMEFDYKIFQSECHRLKQRNSFSKLKKVCTMKKGAVYMRRIAGSNRKYIKLKDLVEEMYQCEVRQPIHDARNDTRLTAAAFFELMKLDFAGIE
jgi:DNA polymerase III epsilon subunit-like protein